MATVDNVNSSIKLPTFDGKKGESAKFWLAKFEQVMKLKKVNNEDKTIQLFLLLEGQAEIWYHTLAETSQGTYKSLKEAFVERFFPSESDRIRDVSRFRGLVQARDEPTDNYIEKVIQLGRELEKTDQEMIDQVYQGLNPVIMRFVAQKEPQDLSEVKKFARMGQSLEKDVPTVEVNKVRGGQAETETRGKCDFQYQKNGYQNRRCYICYKKSHVARDCWFRKDRQ